MNRSYDAGERRLIEQRLRDGGPVSCPVCDTTVSLQTVQPPASVSYVRHRVWVLCPGCRRTASIDGIVARDGQQDR